ncbi:hypothetical protein PHMEG_0006784 [Phytophthora megakarya]|uniref:Uncharacterized protein n=1 Tax=Phytophthora megakarya TaxID=4795 RepID=A0A225WND7_9STRA|nr:hypothetical protein PHMEG_0006784 [Phytophthora megakarya]
MPVNLDVATLDHASHARLRQFQALLFRFCTGLKQQKINVNTKVLNVLLTYLIRHYQQLKELAPSSPLITRVDDRLAAVEIPLSDVVARSVFLNSIAAPPVEEREQTRDRSNHVYSRMEGLLAVIHELIETKRMLVARLAIVEAAQLESNIRQAYTEAKQAARPLEQEPKCKRRIEVATNVSATWRVPCLDSGRPPEEIRCLPNVSFMRFFLTEGFALDDKAANYKAQVLYACRRVEDVVFAFLQTQHRSPKGTGRG